MGVELVAGCGRELGADNPVALAVGVELVAGCGVSPVWTTPCSYTPGSVSVAVAPWLSNTGTTQSVSWY